MTDTIQGQEWLTKEVYKKALENGNVVMTAANHGRNGITQYNLYISTPDGLCSVRGHSSYWSKAKQCYWVTCWGTSRPLEIILSVGYSLGLDFHEIKQNWRFL